MSFDALLAEIPKIGLEHHRDTIIANSVANAQHIFKTVRSVKPCENPALVISAGPSLYRKKILARLKDRLDKTLPWADCGHDTVRPDNPFTIIATDGAYIQCLKAGILPDWVITLDPHPTRMVRWFGDPDFEKNANGDDYFARQDLDVDFRKNSAIENAANIALVNENRVRLAICSTAPANVVKRTERFDRYWFAPLVDAPVERSITRTITEATGLPALNTGGTVGTAAWVFARTVLKSTDIAVVGMDFGYPADTPLEKTQEWNLLRDKDDIWDYYPRVTGHWDSGFTSPTYWWYRENFLDLLNASSSMVTNCSGAGFLAGRGVRCTELEEWLASS